MIRPTSTIKAPSTVDHAGTNPLVDPLLELSQKKEVNHKSGFVQVGRQLARLALRPLFEQAMQLAPRRHRRDKRYLTGHKGVPGTQGVSNQGEAHLAIALFNRHGPRQDPMPLAGQDFLHLLDYQMPLKERSCDRGVGKVDLFGVTSDGSLCIVELKTGQDTPLKALLHGLAYAAVVRANQQDIGSEIGIRSSLPPLGERLVSNCSNFRQYCARFLPAKSDRLAYIKCRLFMQVNTSPLYHGHKCLLGWISESSGLCWMGKAVAGACAPA
ncbi:MAG: hypothetical protein HQM06_16435 [Magnetococcales bacterium]|nr:hypothetical protein [Magnetococcales bacterium]